MYKSLLYIFLSFLVLLLGGCSQGEDEYLDNGSGNDFVSTDLLSHDVLVVRMQRPNDDTRTMIDSTGAVVWGATDELYAVNASARINALNYGVYHGIPTANFSLTSGDGTKQATFMGTIWQKDSCIVNFLFPYSVENTYASPIYNDKTYENYANPRAIPISVEGQDGTMDEMLRHDFLTASGEIMDRAVDAHFERRVAWLKIGFVDTFGVPMLVSPMRLDKIRIRSNSGSFVLRDTLDMSNPSGVFVDIRDTTTLLSYDLDYAKLSVEKRPEGYVTFAYFAFIPSGEEVQMDVYLSNKIASYAGSFKPVTLEPNALYTGVIRLQLVEHAEGGFRRFYDGIVSTSVAACGNGTKDDYTHDDISMSMYGVTKDNYYSGLDTVAGGTMAGTKYDYTSPWDSIAAGTQTAIRDDYGAIATVVDYMTGIRTDYLTGEVSREGSVWGVHRDYDSKDAEQLPLAWFYHDPYEGFDVSRDWFIKLLHKDYDNTEDARGWFINLFHKEYENTEDPRSWFIKVFHRDYVVNDEVRAWFIELVKQGYVSPWAIFVLKKQEAEKDGYENGGNTSGTITGSKDDYQYNK